MECFLVVLFIIVIFAIFICLENSGYFQTNNKPKIIEGMSEVTEGDYLRYEETIKLAGRGRCKVEGEVECPASVPPDQEGYCPGYYDRPSCEGTTGSTFSNVSINEKNENVRDFIRPPTGSLMKKIEYR